MEQKQVLINSLVGANVNKKTIQISLPFVARYFKVIFCNYAYSLMDVPLYLRASFQNNEIIGIGLYNDAYTGEKTAIKQPFQNTTLNFYATSSLDDSTITFTNTRCLVFCIEFYP